MGGKNNPPKKQSVGSVGPYLKSYGGAFFRTDREPPPFKAQESGKVASDVIVSERQSTCGDEKLRVEREQTHISFSYGSSNKGHN